MRHHRAYPGISEHITNIFRAYPNIFRAYPGISGHIRAFPGISGHDVSRAVSSVAGSRPSNSSRAVRFIAGSRAVSPVAHSRLVTSPVPLGDLTSLRWSRSGIPNARRRPCPGPTWPVADAANRCFETFILLDRRGVPSRHVRRRG